MNAAIRVFSAKDGVGRQMISPLSDMDVVSLAPRVPALGPRLRERLHADRSGRGAALGHGLPPREQLTALPALGNSTIRYCGAGTGNSTIRLLAVPARGDPPVRLSLDSTTRLVFGIHMDRRQRVTLLTEAALPDREHGVPSVLNAPTSPVGVTTVRLPGGGSTRLDARHADQRLLALVWLLSDVLWREGQAHGPRVRGSRHDLHGPPSRRCGGWPVPHLGGARPSTARHGSHARVRRDPAPPSRLSRLRAPETAPGRGAGPGGGGVRARQSRLRQPRGADRRPCPDAGAREGSDGRPAAGAGAGRAVCARRAAGPRARARAAVGNDDTVRRRRRWRARPRDPRSRGAPGESAPAPPRALQRVPAGGGDADGRTRDRLRPSAS